MAKNHPNKPSKILRRAIRRIERGWGKRALINQPTFSNAPELCILGAVGRVNDERTVQLIAEVICDKTGRDISRLGPSQTIISFNDGMATTRDDVLDVMKTALIRAECDEAEERLDALGLS